MGFPTPLVAISWGELFDKISILEIKKSKALSDSVLFNINNELDKLVLIRDAHFEISVLVEDLRLRLFDVNSELWDVEDRLRQKELDKLFDAEFIALARMVYKLNDKRAEVKRTINNKLGSELVEEKIYKKY